MDYDVYIETSLLALFIVRLKKSLSATRFSVFDGNVVGLFILGRLHMEHLGLLCVFGLHVVFVLNVPFFRLLPLGALRRRE